MNYRIVEYDDGTAALHLAGQRSIIYESALAAQRGYHAMERQAAYVREVKEANRKIWEGISELAALKREWDALALGDTLIEVEGVPPADVGAVVHATREAFETLLAQGHATNMARLLR